MSAAGPFQVANSTPPVGGAVAGLANEAATVGGA